MGALPPALNLGVKFPHHGGLLVAHVELPVLLPLVAHIYEAVLDQWREVFSSLVGTGRVAERGHELDLQIGDVAAIDLAQRRMVPIAVVPHAHQPVLRLGRRTEEALIGHLLSRGRGDGEAEAGTECGRGEEAGEAELHEARLPEIKRLCAGSLMITRRVAISRFVHCASSQNLMWPCGTITFRGCEVTACVADGACPIKKRIHRLGRFSRESSAKN